MKDIKIIQYNNKKKINLYNLLNSKYTAVIVHGMFDEKEILKARLELINFFNTKKYKWLNVLFKEGEFSFTYFFIPSNIGIFCPDFSKKAKILRKENLNIRKFQTHF